MRARATTQPFSYANSHPDAIQKGARTIDYHGFSANHSFLDKSVRGEAPVTCPENHLVWNAGKRPRSFSAGIDGIGEFRNVSIRPGRFILVPAGYYWWWALEGDTETVSVRLTADALDELDVAVLRLYVGRRGEQRFDKIAALVECIRDELANPTDTSPSLVNGFRQSLSVMLLRSFARVPRKSDPFSMEHVAEERSAENKLRAFIGSGELEDCVREQRGIKQIARELKLSSPHCGRVFHRLMGIGFTDYVYRLRMNRAGALLREGMTGTKAATDVAYSDRSHFNRDFKNHFGVSPGVYADSHRPR
jgi:AraC-like DNA-binding protein